MKKNTTISIDERILREAKINIPNMSRFVENCFKAYLGYENDFNILDIEKEVEQIKQSNLNIYIISEKNDKAEIQNKTSVKDKNNAWLKVWRTYQSQGSYLQTDLLNACGVLGLREDELLDVMIQLKMYCSKEDLINCDNWDYAYKKYCEG